MKRVNLELPSQSNQMKSEKGIFLSDRCHCQLHNTYGFAPEADCAEHDTKLFHDFVRTLIAAREAEVRENLLKEVNMLMHGHMKVSDIPLSELEFFYHEGWSLRLRKIKAKLEQPKEEG